MTDSVAEGAAAGRAHETVAARPDGTSAEPSAPATPAGRGRAPQPGQPRFGPVFAVVQGIALVFFVIVIIGAVRRFRPTPTFA